jgi:hypothetical protein
MKNNEHSLENLHIESPCEASWGGMEGSDSQRHCELCSLNVHNLSAMTRNEGQSVLKSQEEGKRLCVRMEFHPDGSPVTSDHPLGAPEEKSSKGKKVAALVLSAGLMAACVTDEGGRQNQEIKQDQVVPDPPPTTLGRLTMPTVVEGQQLSCEEEPGHALLGRVLFVAKAGDSCELPQDELGEGCDESEPIQATQGEVSQPAPPPPIMGTPGPPRPKPKDK